MARKHRDDESFATEETAQVQTKEAEPDSQAEVAEMRLGPDGRVYAPWDEMPESSQETERSTTVADQEAPEASNDDEDRPPAS